MASAGGYLSYENISDRATVAGVEVEIRKNLFVRPLSSAANGMNKPQAEGMFLIQIIFQIEAGQEIVYRLKDDVEEISNIRLGYTGRFVDDSFKATEYNLTVEHASDFPSLPLFTL